MRRQPRRDAAFLQHGVGPGNELVCIDRVASGKTRLHCPYCDAPLTAKKGRVLVAHFAHAGPTCRESSERGAARIPLYDDFDSLGPLAPADLRFCASLLGSTINSSSIRGWRRACLARLVDEDLIEEVPRGQRWVNGIGSHRHSPWGERVCKALRYRLNLVELGAAQERAALAKLARLEAEAAADPRDRAVIDLRLYRAQLARVLALDLYFLEVTCDGEKLHKIGVTQRAVETRLDEIRRDLAPHFHQVDLRVEGVWARRGMLELYFKRCFAKQRASIGTLTEYFRFDGRVRGGRRPFAMLAKLEPWKLPPGLEALVASE